MICDEYAFMTQGMQGYKLVKMIFTDPHGDLNSTFQVRLRVIFIYIQNKLYIISTTSEVLGELAFSIKTKC